MPTLFLQCAACQTPTLHRSPMDSVAGSDRTQPVVQCDACGTIREVPANPAEDPGVLATDATRLLALLPAMSRKTAHTKLEELLYEHRSAIEDAEAYRDAIASTDGADFEIQDIKVGGYRPEQTAVIVDFTYYALGEGDAAPPTRGIRIAGSGSGRIDSQGNMEIRDVTAAVSNA